MKESMLRTKAKKPIDPNRVSAPVIVFLRVMMSRIKFLYKSLVFELVKNSVGAVSVILHMVAAPPQFGESTILMKGMMSRTPRKAAASSAKSST